MSEQNTTVLLENNCLVKDETGKCPNLNSIQLGFIKDEIPTYQNNDCINQSYHIEDSNIINKSNNITLESFDVDAVNVLEIKTEKCDGHIGTQNSILVIENRFLVKDEVDIKEEILTYLTNDDSNETYMKNISLNTDKSIIIDNLNACVEIKTEKDCEDISIQNSISVIEDGYSVKVEKDSFPSTNDNNSSCYNEMVFNKIEQLSPECCDIFKENIYEVKTEIDFKSNNFETPMNDLKNDQGDVKKHNTNQLKSITNDDEKHNKCDICQKSFIKKQTLKSHMFTHTSKKPHKCNMCQKLFACNSKLKIHIFTHTGKRPYKCNICHKSFSENGTLKRHMFTHTGEKPYKCDICLNSFAQKDTIEKHMFTHNREKPYKCNICEKTFTRKPYLKDHIVTHTGKKPHKCKICQKSFSQKGILRRHMFTHTGEKPNKCNICKKSFIRKSELKTHISNRTNKKKNKCNFFKKKL